MDSKLFFNQVRLQLPRMDGVAIKNENDNMYFYVDGRKEFYVRPTGGVSFETDCSYTSFIDTLKTIKDEFGNTITQQLYDIENGTMMLEEPLCEAAKYLADGGDVDRIRELSDQDAFLKPYEELKVELEQEEQEQGGMDLC